MDDIDELAKLRLQNRRPAGLETEETYPAIDPNEHHVDLSPQDVLSAVEDLKQRKMQMEDAARKAAAPGSRANRSPAESYSAIDDSEQGSGTVDPNDPRYDETADPRQWDALSKSDPEAYARILQKMPPEQRKQIEINRSILNAITPGPMQSLMSRGYAPLPQSMENGNNGLPGDTIDEIARERLALKKKAEPTTPSSGGYSGYKEVGKTKNGHKIITLTK